MQRIPEPELLDDPAQARAYAEADFAEPHQRFVTLFRERFPGLEELPLRALDLGCGPADVTLRMARAHPGWTIDGVDGARAMLEEGRRRLQGTPEARRIRLHRGLLPGWEPPQAAWPVVFSNSLLHHLADAAVLWRSVRRYAAPGARVFVMDLMRPRDRAQAESLVAIHAAGADPLLRRDFHHSLLAAYTPGEIEAQLRAAGLGGLSVEAVSDRHLVAFGIVGDGRGPRPDGQVAGG